MTVLSHLTARHIDTFDVLQIAPGIYQPLSEYSENVTVCGASRMNMQPNTTYIISTPNFPQLSHLTARHIDYLEYSENVTVCGASRMNQPPKSHPIYHKKPSYITFH